MMSVCRFLATVGSEMAKILIEVPVRKVASIELARSIQLKRVAIRFAFSVTAEKSQSMSYSGVWSEQQDGGNLQLLKSCA